MIRRDFLKTILLTAAAPQLLLHLGKPKWKNTAFTQTQNGIWVLNPEWVNAEFEMAFIAKPTGAIKEIIFNRSKNLAQQLELEKSYNESILYSESAPMRFKHNERGRLVVVPMCIEKESIC